MPRSTSGTLAPALGSAALSRSLDDPGGTTGVVPFPFPAMTKPRFNATGAIDDLAFSAEALLAENPGS
jgi:hypothetical protein